MQTDKSTRTERRAHAGLVLSALIVGISFPAVGQITQGLPPLSLTAVRFAIAALAVWPLVSRLPGLWPGVRGLALYGVLGLCLAAFFGTMFWAAHHASALSMAAMYVSVPAIAYMLGRVFRVEQYSPRLIAILLIGAAGALALIWAESRTASETIALGHGEAAFLLACVGAASYPVLSKFGLQRGWLSPSAELRTFWSLLTGSVAIGSMALLTETPGELVSMTFKDVLIVIYLATFSSGLTFWLSQRATAVLTPGAITAYSYTAPFISMLLLFISEPQQMGLRWLPGSLLVALAIGLLFSMDRTHRKGANTATQRPIVSNAAQAACSN